jgi:hypothetical protein
MLKYKDVKVTASVNRSEIVSDMCDEAHITKVVCKFTTWRSDIINSILEDTLLTNRMKPGDRISIVIETDKNATWEDNTATETK